MCRPTRHDNDLLTAEDEQRIELILDLTRRIQLLEDLMSAARAKPRITAEGISMPASVAIDGTDIH